MNRFAVIDTETTWKDELMSLGIVLASSQDFKPISQKYYILTPYKDHSAMYTYALYINGIIPDLECSRSQAMNDLTNFLTQNNISDIFAYNATFDYHHLPELHHLNWYDIMKLAAYRQYNKCIPSTADCFSTGRLKSGYGVESIYRMLSKNQTYHELHNALTDAVDELEIMRLLKIPPARYTNAKIN